MNAPSTFRVVLVQLAGYLNLLIGLIFLAIGAWIIVSGVQAINLLFEAQDQISNAVPQGVVAQNAEAAKVADTGTKGLAGIIAGLAGIAGAVMIAFGLPHLLVALGIFMRTGWGRILGLLMGLWLVLTGSGLLLGSAGATIPLLNGGLYFLTGLISVIGLVGGSAKVAYYAGKKRVVQAGDKDFYAASGQTLYNPPAPKSAPAIAGAVFALLILGIGIVAFMKLGESTKNQNDSAKQLERNKSIEGTWVRGDAPKTEVISFQSNGVFLLSIPEGLINGKYQVNTAATTGKSGSVTIEYEVPDTVYNAQMLVFQQAEQAFVEAKKKFEFERSPIGIVPSFNEVKPIKSFKETISFSKDDKSKKLTLSYPKQSLTYSTATESQVSEILALATKGKVDLTPPTGKKDPVITPTPEPTSEEAYRQRLASVMDAIEKGQLSRVKEILDSTKLDVNDRDENGGTMLHRAIGSNQFEIARYLLLEKKADITATDKTGHDVFLLACAKGYGHTLRNVLRVASSIYLTRGEDYISPKGASSSTYLTFNYTPRLKNNLGQTGWMLAAKNGHLETLVEFKKSPSSWNGSNETSLRDNAGKSATDLAKEAGHTAVVEYLESGKLPTVIVPKVDPKTPVDPTPKTKDLLLVKAAQDGDTTKVVDLLNQANAESLIAEADDKGMTALMIAASKGNVDIVAAICNKIRATKPEPLGLKDKTEKTALIHAAMGGHADACELIMVALSEAWKKHQINWFDIFDAQDSTKKSAYEYAEANKHPATAKILKETFLALCDSVTRDFPKADFRSDDSYKTSTVLEKACREGKLHTVKRMLALGAKPPTALRTISDDELTQQRVRTPLMWACEKGHFAIVKALLESYGDDQAGRLNQLNITCTQYKYNAIQYACSAGQYACAKALLDSIGDNGKELQTYATGGISGGTSPKDIAKGGGHQEIVTLIDKYLEKAKELEVKSKEEKK